MSGLCALGHRGGSKGCFVLTNLKANPGGAHHTGQYMQLTDGKHVHVAFSPQIFFKYSVNCKTRQCYAPYQYIREPIIDPN